MFEYRHSQMEELVHKNKIWPAEFARQLRVSRETVRKYLTGEAKPTIGMLVKICNLYGEDPSTFFGRRVQ